MPAQQTRRPPQPVHTPNYDDIGSASGTRGGVRFATGNHRVRVTRVIDKHSQKDSARLFIIETEVIKSGNPALEIGDRPSSVIKFGQYPKMSLGDVADFMRAALASLSCSNGVFETPESVELTPAIANEVSGEDNICVGVELDVYGYHKTPDTDFVSLTWSVPKDIAQAAAAKGA